MKKRAYKEYKEQNRKISLINRFLIIYAIVVIGFFCLMFRLSYIKLISNDEYYEKALELWTRSAPVSGARGNIYDCNGKLIVGSMLSPTLVAIPRQVVAKESAAKDIARILDVKEEDILKHLKKSVSVEIIKPEAKRISVSEASAIAKLKYKGLYIVADTTRYYPYEDLLAHVIGIVGVDNQGLTGLEFMYDEYLKGKPGAIQIYTDAHGENMSDLTSFYVDAKNGNDLYLTINLDLQLALDRVVDNAVARYDPAEVSSIVMNPKDSSILAMASYPSFDMSNYQAYDQETYNRNLPIWSSYEPGSVFKIVTFSAGIEQQVFKLDDPFYDPGYTIVEGVRIRDWKKGGHGKETFLQVIENSCNPGFMEIGRRLGVERLFSYIRAYGFGEKTGIDLLGESTGIVFKETSVGPVELATSAFGQGNSVTMIQLVNATSAAVNGGLLHTPYVLKMIKDGKSIILEKEPILKKRVINEDTSKTMCYALESVASLGTARSAYIPSYRVGGKTGTAQVAVNGVYDSSQFILSFIGIAPMNDPSVVAMMAIKNAKNTIQYGGVVVAPLVKEILEASFTILNVPPQEGGMAKSKQYWYDLPLVKVKDYRGYELRYLPKYESYQFKIEGKGDTVIDQIPEPGEEIKQDGFIILYT